MQTMVDDQHYPDDEISLLDLMVVIAEHWLVLVFVPLLAAWLLTVLLPSSPMPGRPPPR